MIFSFTINGSEIPTFGDLRVRNSQNSMSLIERMKRRDWEKSLRDVTVIENVEMVDYFNKKEPEEVSISGNQVEISGNQV